MTDKWEDQLTCAIKCERCEKGLAATDKRILSAYDHQPICMACKQAEEKRPDYEQTSRKMVGQCMIDTEVQWGDPGGYCFHHFYPYTCT